MDGVPDVKGNPNWPQMQALMRRILAERFAMKVHHEQREMPVYALTVARSGEKMTPNTSDPSGLEDQRSVEGNGQQTQILKNTSMGELAQILEFRVDRPVVDRTGLDGKYDFTLKWTEDETKAPTDGSAAPSLFTAIQEQLGLKLEPVKAPADVLVIDQVEPPGAN